MGLVGFGFGKSLRPENCGSKCHLRSPLATPVSPQRPGLGRATRYLNEMRIWDELLWKKDSKATLLITLGNFSRAEAEGDSETGGRAALRHQKANRIARKGFSAEAGAARGSH